MLPAQQFCAKVENDHRYCYSRYMRRFNVPSLMPPDIDPKDAGVLADLLHTHTDIPMHLGHKWCYWDKLCLVCDATDGRITEMNLPGFDFRIFCLGGATSYQMFKPYYSTPLSKLEKLEKLQLDDCVCLPSEDLPSMKSLRRLNINLIDIRKYKQPPLFSAPLNRDWYPPNLQSFRIHGHEVKADPLDALIAYLLVIVCPPIGVSAHFQDILRSKGIDNFVKYHKKTGRITEFRLSSRVANSFLLRSARGIYLQPSIETLEMLKTLHLFKVALVPTEISRLKHLKVLRLDSCPHTIVYPENVDLPTVINLQIRDYARGSVWEWATTCFPSLQSLEIINVGTSSLDRVLRTLGNRGWKEDGGKLPMRFRESLIKLHVSAVDDTEIIQAPEQTLFGILDNHPNLCQLYVERVQCPGQRPERKHHLLESLMFAILKAYPRVRRLSIGGPNSFTFDQRRVHSIYRISTNTLLNLNRCGRELLMVSGMNNCDLARSENGANTAIREKERYEKERRWIPVSLWARVLTRAQKIPLAGTYLGYEKKPAKRYQTEQQMTATYVLLRNGPAMAFREQFGFAFVVEAASRARGRKKNKGNRRKITRKGARKRKFSPLPSNRKASLIGSPNNH